MSKNLISKMICEFLGALAIVFFGCGAVAWGHLPGGENLLNNIPWVFGLTISVMIYAVGHISGAHFNPAVTLAFALVRRFPWRQLPFYWLAQFVGAIVGAACILYFSPETSNLGVTQTHLPMLKAILFEALLSFFLMFVIISVATDSRAVGTMAGAAIGITVAMDAFIGGGFTGASMNPARSFGPALMEKNFSDLWIYFLGPCLGTCTAAGLYERIRCEAVVADSNSDQDAKGCC
ncbi:MAG: MIP family channel protein [Deltaproteobacteria bacterium]|nr:MIP family channel protein [Deltaproteobacteria bacterium]